MACKRGNKLHGVRKYEGEQDVWKGKGKKTLMGVKRVAAGVKIDM